MRAKRICGHRCRWLAGLLVPLLLAACGGSSGGGAPAGNAKPASGSGSTAVSASSPLGKLIAQARQEGTLNVTTPSSAAGGSVAAQDVVALIAKRYGVHLKLNYTPAPAMPVMLSRMEQEEKAGQPGSTDIWMGASIQVVPAIQQKLLRTVPWTTYVPELQRLSTTARNQVDVKSEALALYAQIPSINYNTKLVPKSHVPHKLTDLLQPWWKGKLATTVYGAYINDLASKSLWGMQKTLAFEKQLLAQKPGLVRCGDDSAVASGQYDALALDCTATYAVEAAAKGAPVGWVVPTDAALIDEDYIGVPKNAQHPAAAELYGLTFLSARAQGDLWQLVRSDDYQLPGSHVLQMIKKAEAQGAKFTNVGYPFGIHHPEVGVANTSINRLIKATG